MREWCCRPTATSSSTQPTAAPCGIASATLRGLSLERLELLPRIRDIWRIRMVVDDVGEGLARFGGIPLRLICARELHEDRILRQPRILPGGKLFPRRDR